MEEVFADVDEEHERSMDDLKESLEQAKKLKEDIESINRDLKKNRDPDWQTQKKNGRDGKAVSGSAEETGECTITY